eukprot:4778978-Amphidinium_carterae.1
MNDDTYRSNNCQHRLTHTESHIARRGLSSAISVRNGTALDHTGESPFKLIRGKQFKKGKTTESVNPGIPQNPPKH